MKNIFKVIGWILIIIAAFDFLSAITLLADDLVLALVVAVSPAVRILTGYWLIKNKGLALYGMGATFLIKLVELYFVGMTREVSFGNYLFLILYLVLFIWLFSAKKQFSK